MIATSMAVIESSSSSLTSPIKKGGKRSRPETNMSIGTTLVKEAWSTAELTRAAPAEEWSTEIILLAR